MINVYLTKYIVEITSINIKINNLVMEEFNTRQEYLF